LVISRVLGEEFLSTPIHSPPPSGSPFRSFREEGGGSSTDRVTTVASDIAASRVGVAVTPPRRGRGGSSAQGRMSGVGGQWGRRPPPGRTCDPDERIHRGGGGPAAARIGYFRADYWAAGFLDIYNFLQLC
jgi:hypothetical protein